MGLKNLINRFFNKNRDAILKAEDDSFIYFDDSMLRVIHVNPNVYLANRGARICIGRLPTNTSNEARMEFIEKVARRGHESVMEHTNSIVVLLIPNHDIGLYPDQFGELMAATKYCNVSSRKYKESTALLIGGSARAWLHLLREVSPTNLFLPWITSAIEHTYEKCFLISAIENGWLDEEKCSYLGDGNIKLVKDDITQVKNPRESKDSADNYTAEATLNDPIEEEGERVDVVYQTPMKKVLEDISYYGFGIHDLYQVATVTFRFHDISRTCSHQLVRHRNGISQESQRYVTHDYNKHVDFIDPIVMNYDERYKDHPYFGYVREKIKETDPFVMYKYLISNKVTKEDARAWLPSNVTTQLLMTMTYTNLAKFLQLRMHPSAQKEIRLVANEVAEKIIKEDETHTQEEKRDNFINYAITPKRSLLGNKEKVEDPLMNEVEVDKVDDEITTNPEPININTLEEAGNLIKQNEELK